MNNSGNLLIFTNGQYGALFLFALLFIISCVVLIIKLALDIKLAGKFNNVPEQEQEEEKIAPSKKFFYMAEKPKAKKKSPPRLSPISSDKLYVLENDDFHKLGA